MIKVKLEELLKEKGRSKYWLRKKINTSSGRDFNNLITGRTTSIAYTTLNKLCSVLECKVEDILEFIPDK